MRPLFVAPSLGRRLGFVALAAVVRRVVYLLLRRGGL
jgi:hypothetical protein